MIALIVAGGRSRRFGRDKRLYDVSGVPLLVRTASVVGELGVGVIVAGAEGAVPWPDKTASWLDRTPGGGPFPVVLEALEWRQDDVLCVAADLPHLTTRSLRNLVDTACSSRHDVVAYRGERGPEPLCALYRRSAWPWMATAHRAGQTSLRRLLEQQAQRVMALPPAPANLLHNLNCPADRGEDLP